MIRLARTTDGRALVGDDEGFVPLSAADPALHGTDAAIAASDRLPDPTEATAAPIPDSHLTFAQPLKTLGKLWGIGLNYEAHAGDLDEERPEEPASFMKPTTAVTGPGGPIRLPPPTESDRVTAEAELGVVIGRTCRDVSTEEFEDVVAGFVPVIDMTAEDVLRRNPRFLTRAKSYDTFIVLGPWIRTTEGIGDLSTIEVRTVVNDEVRAENTVANMLFPPRELVSFHSRVMTLEPGDIISTGTPGATKIEPGDTVRAEVDRVGTLAADVVSEKS